MSRLPTQFLRDARALAAAMPHGSALTFTPAVAKALGLPVFTNQPEPEQAISDGCGDDDFRHGQRRDTTSEER